MNSVDFANLQIKEVSRYQKNYNEALQSVKGKSISKTEELADPTDRQILGLQLKKHKCSQFNCLALRQRYEYIRNREMVRT
uniref:Uncharacterized protein n=1 Tax=Rhabditophanes sp. KR3021 TaxID=114890 RepID=A0AC35TK65_9BILA